MTAVDELLALMDREAPGPGLYNPWRQRDERDLSPGAAAQRVERLRQHWAITPRLILVGEAAGYQGCRYSGIPFTSERLLCVGAIPRIPPTPRFTLRPRPFSEPSATIVWGTLERLGLAHHTVLWNALPWHPMRSDNPLSNRSPTPAELALGRTCLAWIREHYPHTPLVAVGQKAAAALEGLGVEVPAVRHPANGGATRFAQGLAELAARWHP